MTSATRFRGRARGLRLLAGRLAASATILAALVCLLVPASVAGRSADASATPVSPADTTATDAYLAAYYTFTQAVVAELASAPANLTPTADALEGECPAVLAAAPGQETDESPEASPFTKPREYGEQVLHEQQFEVLADQELPLAISAAAYPQRPRTAAAFASAADALHWSDAAITRGVHAYASLIASHAETVPLHVCADMRSWVASGYKTLPQAAKELEARDDAGLRDLLGSTPLSSIGPGSPALAPYEGPAAKALLADIQALTRQARPLEARLEAIEAQLSAALGIHEASRPHEGARGVVIGMGRTASGESFVAKLEPAAASEHGCLNVTITSGDSSDGGCFLAGQHGAEPSVNCNAGLLTIQSVTLPTTRRVRLRLSNGRTITSAALIIPARLGGPAGLYFQVVRGPSPIPVSLTELDAHGKPLRTVRLPAIVECTAHPLKYLPGGIRTLVQGRVPGGTTFSIVAERYRFLGKLYLELKLNMGSEAGQRGGAAVGGLTVSSGGSHHAAATRAFKPQESSGCHPQPYAIIYGILKAPHDRLLARTPSGLAQLHTVTIPAELHAGGVLAYGAFSPPPSALLLRAPNGRTLSSESLTERAKGTVEECEGESEASAEAAAHRAP